MKANTNKGKYDLGIITDTHAAPAKVHDSIVYLGRLDRQVERSGFAVGLEDRDGYGQSTTTKPGIGQGHLPKFASAIA